MAQLRGLGQPFGSPGGIINIPAPAGSALAGQIQMRAMEGLGQALGQYLGQQRQQELWQQDIQNMQVAQQSQLPQGVAGPQMGMPTMQSRMAQQAQMQSQLGQMFPAPADPFTLPPGAGRYTGTGEPVAEREAVPKRTQASSVITDPDDPDRAIRVRDTFDEQGNLINRQYLGEATLAEKIGGVAPEAFTQMQRPVATKIQTELKDVKINIANLKAIRDQYKDEYSEYPFRLGTKVTKWQEKAGGLLGMPSAERKKALADFSAWRRNGQREFVVFKKWATGVAAGQTEMKEQIELAFPSALGDSATEFKSKLDSAIRVQERTEAILSDMLTKGTVMTMQDKRSAERNALKQALSEERQRGQQQGTPVTATNPQTGEKIQSFDGGQTWQPIQ